MIVVTGAAGFIGANIVSALNAEGRGDVVAVDVKSAGPHYLDGMRVCEFVERDAFPIWLRTRAADDVEAVLHMGACSDTTCSDREFIMRNNLQYTQALWTICADRGIRFVYASSAATYGDGSNGYDDCCDPATLKPLNMYGESKQLFDLWALEQKSAPNGWAGLKFFNVYGPYEKHKGRMASVVLHAFNQIKANGFVQLFASDRPGIPDGGQMRDFIYVKDVVATVLYCARAPRENVGAIYNVGTGKARSFADLSSAVFRALNLKPTIEYIPMPHDLKGKYQYFTEAKMEKLRASGMTQAFYSLEDGVADYVGKLSAECRVPSVELRAIEF